MLAYNSFNSIIGHAEIIKSLRQSMAVNRISHAYIFSGQSASGKMALAMAFTKALMCQSPAAGDACGLCAACKTLDSGNNPDVFFIRPSKKSLGIDDIRSQVLKPMETRPYRHPYKIFIIDQAHTMTVASQNALLKTIEEPAGYGIFLLLTENAGAFLPTVLSRCIVYKLRPLSEDTIYNYLLQKNHPPEQARLAAVYAQGSIDRADALASGEEFMLLRSQVISVVRRLRRGDIPQVFAASKELAALKEHIDDALDILYLWYRDAAVYKLLGEDSHLIQKDMKAHIAESCREETAESLFRKLDAVQRAKAQMRQNGNFALVLDIMLLDFAG